MIFDFEEEMDYIDIKSIKEISLKGNSLTFQDNINEYNFNISKSTLSKRFHTPKNPTIVDVEILENPFGVLQDVYYRNIIDKSTKKIKDETEYIILPLYSTVNNNVMKKSGLNKKSLYLLIKRLFIIYTAASIDSISIFSTSCAT